MVTGAGGGIGRAVALRLAEDGLAIAAMDRSSDAAHDTAAAVIDRGGKAVWHAADVALSADWVAALDSVESALGPVSVLVNCAGIEGTFAMIDDYPEADFAAVMAVNAGGTYLGMHHTLARMRARGAGSIVNIASTSAIRGRSGLAGYVASKHAVLGLTRVAALDMAGTGIRVNAVLPGPVETRMIHAIDARAAAAGRDIQRAGTASPIPPESVAEMVAFLASDRATYVNGAALVVDCGSTIP